MTTIGEVEYRLSLNTKDFDSGVNNANRSFVKLGDSSEMAGKSAGNRLSAGWAATVGVISGITQQVFSKVTGIISNAVSGAVNRFDTLNNFPKVMNNLGISSEDSADSIAKISQNIKGLPTRLNDAASAVQRFTTINGDIDKSTDLFLAVNNAILAGGQSMDVQSTALEQLSQAYSKGKPDMMEWRSLQTAMPAQLKQVADAMGMTTNELGEGLRNGTISMDEFLGTISRLNKEGVGDFASFEQQAKGATGGVNTSLANLEAAAQRGIGKVLEAFGNENIVAAISTIGSALEGLGTVVANIITFIAENEVARTALLAFLITLGIVLLGTIIPAFIAWGVAMLANPITWIVLGVTALITGLILLVTHIEEVGKFFSDVFSAIGDLIGTVTTNIGNFFAGVFEGIGEGLKGIGEFFHSIFQGIGDFIGGIVTGIGNFFNGMFNGVKGALQGVRDFFSNIFGAIGNIVKAPINGIIKGINGVLKMINSITIPDWVPVIGGAHTNFGMIPELATGGIVQSTPGGQIIRAGEAGEDEWVVPESKMASMIEQLANNGVGGNTINITVSGVFATSPEEQRRVAEQIAGRLEELNIARMGA